MRNMLVTNGHESLVHLPLIRTERIIYIFLEVNLSGSDGGSDL
jgi:hypothetical protein